MAINKPFYRIYRPGLDANAIVSQTVGYERDSMFLPEEERKSMLFSARLIIDDFEHLFEFIEPHDNHLGVFSHRIYELLLRTCTEVESCCKGILLANDHPAKAMDDYKKIEQSSHLSSYAVHYSNWFPGEYITTPFASWATGDPLPWYKAYNDVKHNRGQQFQLASLKNLLDAISGLLCIIHAQIGESVQYIFESNIYLSSSNPNVSIGSFTISPCQMPDEEKYDFVWHSLKSEPDRFQKFKYK